MELLNYKEKDFLISHFQGGSISGFYAISEYMKNVQLSVPENVQIVTVCNRPEISILMQQLEKWGIGYINETPFGGAWKNTNKIKYILAGLAKVTSEYVLILDANDVLLTRPLTDIVDRFKNFKDIIIDNGNTTFVDKPLKLLFGGTKGDYPKSDEPIDMIASRDARGKYKYLNAGTCFGTTEYAKTFYQEAKRLLDSDEIDNPKHSEQLIIKHAFKTNIADVDFDYGCDIFQSFGLSNARIIDKEKKIYAIE